MGEIGFLQIGVYKKMKNKKGILLPETLKMIIAVICIGLLVYGSVRLFGITTQKTEIEQAGATLDQIVETIDSLGDGEEREYGIQTRKGESWLVYFGDDRLLCICLEGNDKEKCVEEALGVCEETEYVFEMLTPFGGDVNIQYIKLNSLLVSVKIKKSESIINIVKSFAAKSGESWEKFSALKPEEACPGFIEEIKDNVYGIYTEAYEVSEFDSIEELIINLPDYWDEVKGVNPYLFNERTEGFLDECAREFQQNNEVFGIFIIFPEEKGQIPPSFALHPTSPGSPLHQLDMEDYWETTLTIEGDKKIIIKIYPKELFE